MQIGFFTAIMGDQPIERVAEWAAGAGFACLELDMGNHGGDAGVTRKAVAAVRSQGLEVCCLTCFGNLVDADPAARERIHGITRTAVDVAADLGVDLVCTFPGRNDSISEDDNYRQLADFYTLLAEQAAPGKVKIIMENWPGPRINYLATTPAGWAKLFDLAPAPNLGLNFDPSHLIWQGIEIEPALRAVADRVFLAHAKDTEIFPQALQQTGYFGKGWWTYRLPGRGRIDWGRWLGLLREVGFDGVVSIEHEDGEYGAMRGPLARRQEGLLEGQRALRQHMP
jgi:sugar phosphate isomerase/epimerase